MPAVQGKQVALMHLNQAIHKAQSFNFDLNGAAMASDAFFPFPDCVEIAKNAGIYCCNSTRWLYKRPIKH